MSVRILNPQSTTGAGAQLPLNGDAHHTFQATVTGTGAVSATVLLEASNDGVNFLTLATLSLSGTTAATDGFSMEAPWQYVRTNVTAISGTGAVVDVWAN